MQPNTTTPMPQATAEEIYEVCWKHVTCWKWWKKCVFRSYKSYNCNFEREYMSQGCNRWAKAEGSHQTKAWMPTKSKQGSTYILCHLHVLLGSEFCSHGLFILTHRHDPKKLASTVIPTNFVLSDAFADTSTTIKQMQAVKFITQQSVPKDLAVSINTVTFWSTVSSHIRPRHTLIMQV